MGIPVPSSGNRQLPLSQLQQVCRIRAVARLRCAGLYKVSRRPVCALSLVVFAYVILHFRFTAVSLKALPALAAAKSTLLCFLAFPLPPKSCGFVGALYGGLCRRWHVHPLREKISRSDFWPLWPEAAPWCPSSAGDIVFKRLCTCACPSIN